MRSTELLLAEHAGLMNDFGADSEEAVAFVWANLDDGELADLAETARLLKKALQGATH